MYWYELIHRPVSDVTVPQGYIKMESNHENRCGFKFGKVAYKNKLKKEEMKMYNLEPENIAGMIEISMINQNVLNDNDVKTTVSILNYLIDNDAISTFEKNGWKYISLIGLKRMVASKKTELKEIYKKIKKRYLTYINTCIIIKV